MSRIFRDDWRNGSNATAYFISALEVSSEEDVFLKVVTAEDFPVLKRFCAVAFSRQARTGL